MTAMIFQFYSICYTCFLLVLVKCTESFPKRLAWGMFVKDSFLQFVSFIPFSSTICHKHRVLSEKTMIWWACFCILSHGGVQAFIQPFQTFTGCTVRYTICHVVVSLFNVPSMRCSQIEVRLSRRLKLTLKWY